MFTGIIEGMGEILAIEPLGGQSRLTIRSHFPVKNLTIGESIAVNGTCLTVETGKEERNHAVFTMFASAETLRCTTLSALTTGNVVNLERAMRCGDRFGGHIVAGHIDAVATVLDVRQEGLSKVYTFSYPAHLAAEIASKGSVALDGISLTVNHCTDTEFSVNVIPETQRVTTVKFWHSGGKVNLETDILGKYARRALLYAGWHPSDGQNAEAGMQVPEDSRTLETCLRENGFL